MDASWVEGLGGLRKDFAHQELAYAQQPIKGAPTRIGLRRSYFRLSDFWLVFPSNFLG